MEIISTLFDEWKQDFVLSVAISSGNFVIPLNELRMPNPEYWTRTEKAKRDVDDYYDLIVNQARMHRFSISTKTWYCADRREYIHSTIEPDLKKKRAALEKPLSLEPIEINKSEEGVVAFSSIENFFVKIR